MSVVEVELEMSLGLYTKKTQFEINMGLNHTLLIWFWLLLI